MSRSLDAFFTQYYARHPVNATFTGEHKHDSRLPDWSPDACADDVREMGALRAALASAEPSLDHELACANLDVRSAEHASGFLVARNPALWTGEAIFGAVSLMLRAFAPRAERLEALALRLAAVEPFLAALRVSLTGATPPRWTLRAQRECKAAQQLFGAGLDAWLALEPVDPVSAERVRSAARQARAAFRDCGEWLATRSPAADKECSAGEELLCCFGAGTSASAPPTSCCVKQPMQSRARRRGSTPMPAKRPARGSRCSRRWRMITQRSRTTTARLVGRGTPVTSLRSRWIW